MFIGWWSQWAELKFHEAQSAFLYNFSDDHWLHLMNIKKSNFNSYIYTLFLDHFWVLIVKIQC